MSDVDLGVIASLGSEPREWGSSSGRESSWGSERGPQSGDLELLTSVLSGLGPFLEDEEIPVVVHMQIELLNSRVILKVRGTLGFTLDLVKQGILDP